MKHIFYSTFIFSAFVVCFFSVSAHTTSAYLTTSQKTIELNNGSALFLIEYEFGHEHHEMQMPFITKNTALEATNTLAYTILDKDGQEISGKSSAIILSNSTLGENMMYAVPKGFAKKFTLIVVFNPEASTTEDYRLQVTHLPFNFDGKQQLGLNAPELQYYTTPYTHL